MAMTANEEFVFVTCQRGAEPALKADFAARRRSFRLAFSRPGFLTFKAAPGTGPTLAEEFDHPLARVSGMSLGRAALTSATIEPASNQTALVKPALVEAALVEAASIEPTRIDPAALAPMASLQRQSPATDATSEELIDLVRQVWSVASQGRYDRLHVWQRDTSFIGQSGYRPTRTAASIEAETLLRQSSPYPELTDPNARTELGHRVLDVILVEPRQWWIGWHSARSPHSCWPGGIPPLAEPTEMVSRAWLKMREALLWSGFAPASGDRWAEIGCAPGGSSQALLELDQRVLGIDPAAVAPQIVAHPQFVHVRKRGADVKRREFRGIRFLAADLNVAPQYTLDTVEGIVTHPDVRVEGLLLTLKLLDWSLIAQLPEYLKRIRGWGYRRVEARQLCFNRQELCVAAALDDGVFDKRRSNADLKRRHHPSPRAPRLRRRRHDATK